MQEIFEMLSKNVIISIWIKDIGLKFKFVNKNYAKLHNKKSEEFVGLRGEEIPLLATIISICNSFDIMMNDRVYQRGNLEEADIKELKRFVGTQFYPKGVEAFIKCNS